MLSHLVYVSVRNSTCTDEEIQKILDSCNRNNGGIDVTGVLLYSGSHFVQYLEGDYKTIMALYDKIKGDDRHKNVVLITTGKIENRLFPSWQMGSKPFSGSDVKFNTEISNEETKLFQKILSGEAQEGNKALNLMKKFFK